MVSRYTISLDESLKLKLFAYHSAKVDSRFKNMYEYVDVASRVAMYNFRG